MKHYAIVTDETSIHIRFKPHLPGLGVAAKGLTGALRAAIHEDGVDLSHPIEGEFAVNVDDFELNNRIASYAVKRWLGDSGAMAVRGKLGGFAPTGPRSFEATVLATLLGREYAMRATGAFRLESAERILLDGLTVLHPSDVGVPLPRFGVPHVHVHWALVLAPA